jgi:hypothetical protein
MLTHVLIMDYWRGACIAYPRGGQEDLDEGCPKASAVGGPATDSVKRMTEARQARETDPSDHGAPAAPEPDGKDWTWVLDARCPECGFQASEVDPGTIGRTVRELLPRWHAVLSRPAAGVRSDPLVWSPLEYGCHVRDVFTIFADRAELMLQQQAPSFANWDQDETALTERYWSQEPAAVAAQLSAVGQRAADTFDSVGQDQWQRTGLRSNGSRFTVETLGQYFLHDIVHHLHDVRG